MKKAEGYFTLQVSVLDDKKCVNSLQMLCRSTILNHLGLEKIQKVQQLPVPNVIKEFLTTFHGFDTTLDFDLNGIFVDYNFSFPNHVHHKSHQIHPGKCFGGGKMLMKIEMPTKRCSTCECGTKIMRTDRTREKWANFRHRHLMNCHLKMIDVNKNFVFHILDFPFISLEDYLFQLRRMARRIPEFLVWDTIAKLSHVLGYLLSHHENAWELCQPRHIVINEQSDIKIENMLLYLPVKSGSHFQIDTYSASSYNRLPPEFIEYGFKGVGPKTVVWSLGCVIIEMMGGTSLDYKDIFYTCSALMQNRYSMEMTNLAVACMNDKPVGRPDLQTIHNMSVQICSNIKGKISLLDLL